MSDHDVDPVNGWDILGIADLNNIPSRYSVSWIFFNSFFKAFQERAFYTDGVPRPIVYDDLILDGPQIGAFELRQRLNSFNGLIRDNWPISLFPVERFARPWLKVDTWDTFGSFTAALEDDLEDFEIWSIADVKILLTEDVYNLIFSYQFENNFNPAYWSGIYKLLNIMIYRDMTISTAIETPDLEPNQIDPVLVCNGSETFSETGTDLDALIINSLVESTILVAGTTTITSGTLRADSTADKDEVIFESASVQYGGMLTDPFFKTPLAMEVRTRLSLRGGNSSATVDGQRERQFTLWDSQFNNSITPIPASVDVTTVEGVVGAPVYAPDQATFDGLRFQNLNLPLSFDEEISTTTMDILGVPDIRIDNTIDTSLATPPEFPYVNNIRFNTKTRVEDSEYILDEAIIKIPVDDLIYREV